MRKVNDDGVIREATPRELERILACEEREKQAILEEDSLKERLANLEKSNEELRKALEELLKKEAAN